MEVLTTSMADNAADLFRICDQEEKGFVTKRDMQRMRKEFPLEPEQLESVFDTLDDDHNGYLTLEEFTEGFAKFLGIETPRQKEQDSSTAAKVDEVKVDENDGNDEDDEQFEMLLDELGVRSVIGSDDQALKAMWNTLKLDPNPEMMANFEEVLSKLTGDVQKKTAEQETLENTMRHRTSQQQDQLNKLYEEMEQQLAKERSEIRAEEERKDKKIQREFEMMIQMKDAQMQELMDEKRRLQVNLEKVISSVPEMRDEKDRLAKERDKLERELEKQRYLARELQDQMDALRHQTDAERKERARAAFRVSENIAQEREGIVNQLDHLRTINTKIIDDRDAAGNIAISRSNRNDVYETIDLHRNDVFQPIDVHRNDVCQPNDHNRNGALQSIERNLFNEIEVDEMDDVFGVVGNGNAKPEIVLPIPAPRVRPLQGIRKPISVDSVSLMDEIAETLADSDADESAPFPTWLQLPNRVPDQGSSDQQEDLSSFEDYATRPQYIPKRVRSYPLKRSRGKKKQDPPHVYSSSLVIYTSRRDETTTEESDAASPSQSVDAKTRQATFPSSDYASLSDIQHTADEKNQVARTQRYVHEDPVYQPIKHPERIFKVIFIGDSSVGKTSLITRFCKGEFQLTGTTSTVGINFQTRTLLIQSTSVCLQCWDTAGQERYRSMTRQFFRKADAAVVVYDVTNETSYLNARQWLDSARDAIQLPGDAETSQAEFLLLGNKADLAEDDIKRQVRKSEGLKLARAYSTLFGEVSAADGRNVDHCLTELAKLLAERQDFDIQKTIKLSKKENEKSKCC